jgi:CheY-like chemotaxis protein
MSGYENTENIDFLQAAVTFGATSILRKPFRAAELLQAVAACSPEDS